MLSLTAVQSVWGSCPSVASLKAAKVCSGQLPVFSLTADQFCLRTVVHLCSVLQLLKSVCACCAQSHSCSSLCGAVVHLGSVLQLLKCFCACCLSVLSLTAAQVCGATVHLLSVLQLLKSVGQLSICCQSYSCSSLGQLAISAVLQLLKYAHGSCPTVISLIAAQVCLGQLSICVVLQLLSSV